MKTALRSLVFFSGLCLSVQSFASNDNQFQPVPEDTVALSNLSAELVGVKVVPAPDCQSNDSCLNHRTNVTVMFVLGGCVDALGPVQHLALQKADGKLDLYVSGVNVHTEASKLTRCRIAPRVKHTIAVEGVYSKDDVTVKSLNTTQVLESRLPFPEVDPGRSTCAAYFEGYEFDDSTGSCEMRSTSGCSNPFRYRSVEQCLTAYGLDQ